MPCTSRATCSPANQLNWLLTTATTPPIANPATNTAATGEWQVTHRSSGIHLIHCFDEDMNYVSRINLGRDVGIILRTFGVVLGAKGI